MQSLPLLGTQPGNPKHQVGKPFLLEDHFLGIEPGIDSGFQKLGYLFGLRGKKLGRLLVEVDRQIVRHPEGPSAQIPDFHIIGQALEKLQEGPLNDVLGLLWLQADTREVSAEERAQFVVLQLDGFLMHVHV